jgi:type III protein arginine methyltransferase
VTSNAGQAVELLSRLAECPDEIARMETNPVTLAYFAKMLLSNGKPERAIEFARRAITLAPNDGEVESVASQVLSYDVPRWHFSIVRDSARNAAYDGALRRNVQHGMRVLEIGAGSGILAMMAARAGAGAVISCECNHAVAAIAAEIVALNGFSDRVKIVPKHSRDLEVGKDLDDLADVLVSEIVSNDLLGEDVLGCMENAIGRLTQRNASIIPSHGSVRISLAHYDKLQRKRIGIIHGFDLAPLNCLARRIDLAVGDESLTLRSEPEDLFTFDFSSGGPFDDRRASICLVSSGGCVNGIAQWIKLRMDEKGSYENRPALGTRSCWGVTFYAFKKSIDVAPGGQIIVHGGRDRTATWMWADGF